MERSLRHPLPYALQRYKKRLYNSKTFFHHFTFQPPPPTQMEKNRSLLKAYAPFITPPLSPAPQQTLISQFSCRSANSSLFLSFRLFVSCHLSATRLNFPCRPLMPNRTSLFYILWRSNRFSIPLPGSWGLGWVPGSIPGHGIFSGASDIALGSTQTLKMSTRIFLGVNTAGALG